jgi:hypothetical protein
VGRQGGQQAVLLGYGCHSFPIITHELGHTLGFWHEQSRPDRDDYVEVLYENIQSGQLHNFGKRHSTISLGQVRFSCTVTDRVKSLPPYN